MPIVYTKTGKKILKKAKSMCVLPYKFDASVYDFVLGETVYDLSAIIGDSIVLEQQDGNSQEKYNEFTSEPLVKNVTTGEWRFTAQCLDLQNAVLKALFAAYYNDAKGASAVRDDYAELYVYIRIKFFDTSLPDVVLPKVLMNSKLLLQQMRTRASQCNIGGTAMSRKCSVVDTEAVQSQSSGTLVPFSDPIEGSTTYSIESPVLFVPSQSPVLVINHHDDINKIGVYDQPLFEVEGSDDCCGRDRTVSDDSPGIYEL